jgi:hypothetical protein
MPTITRWGEVKDRIKQASGGGCSEEAAILVANEAIPALLNKGPWLGSVADVRVSTFTPEFSLPFEYERAITAEQVFNGDLNMGWYTVEQSSSYIDPALWGDAVLMDLGTRSTERAFFGSGQVLAQARYPEDADVRVRIYGTIRGEQVFIQPQIDGVFKAQDFEDLVPDSTLSVGTYDELYEVTKPVTKGPIDICAVAASGKIYRLISLAPYETKAARRWYKMPELKFFTVQARSITPEVNGFAIDTQYTQVPFAAGDNIVLTGFCPTVFNGLWTVNAVVESKIYVQALPESGWVMPAGQISVFGKVSSGACFDCSCLKRFIPIVDDESDVILSNTLAMRQAVRAMWAWDKGNHAEYDKLMSAAIEILRDEITRYGQDPTHTLKRKAMYRFYYDTLPTESAGYIVGRLAIEILNGIRYGKSDWFRVLNEAQQYIMSSGKFGDGNVRRTYTIQAGGLVICDPDIISLLVAEIGGRRCEIQDKFYDVTTNKGLIGVGIDGPTGYQVGGYFTNGSLAGGQPRTIVLAQQESIVDEHGCCRTIYKVQPCQALAGCCVCTMARIRYIPVRCIDDVVIIANYAALKFMIEAFMARDAKDFAGFEALKNASFKLLDTEKREKKGGAQARMQYNSGFTGRFLRGRGR